MTYSIHGLECDVELDEASSWPRDNTDYGVVDFAYREGALGGDPLFSRRRFMVSLPMGTGLGPTFESALQSARRVQHAALWGGS
jgi:hypothetical protein